jgi:hypothetical protein
MNVLGEMERKVNGLHFDCLGRSISEADAINPFLWEPRGETYSCMGCCSAAAALALVYQPDQQQFIAQSHS